MTVYEMKQAFSKGKTIFDLPLNVSFYARVSTEKEEQINSLDNQINFFEKYIRQNKNWNFIQGYIDEGISGTTSQKRESFMKMIEDGKHKKFDLLITKEVSRFSRDTIDSLIYTRKLLEYDVCVYFLSDNIITASTDGELRLTIMSSMAQDEVRKISERTKFGFKRAIEKGTVLGTNNIWGYTKKNGKLIIDEEEAEIVKKIFEIYANNKIGLNKLAKELEKQGYYNHNGKPFHQNTLKNIIQNPKYKGYYTGRLSTVINYRTKKRNYYEKKEWITYKDFSKVPPVVSEELWEKANQKLLNRSKQLNKKTSNIYPLSGKIYCKTHKCSFVRKIRHYKNKEDVIFWYCGDYHKTGKKTCNPAYIKQEEIYNTLINKLKKFETYKEKICNELLTLYSESINSKQSSQNEEKIKKEIIILENKKKKLLDLLLDGFLDKDEYLNKKKYYETNLLKMQNDLKILHQEKNKTKNNKTLKQSILKELEISQDNIEDYVEELVDKIIIEEGRCLIRFK